MAFHLPSHIAFMLRSTVNSSDHLPPQMDASLCTNVLANINIAEVSWLTLGQYSMADAYCKTQHSYVFFCKKNAKTANCWWNTDSTWEQWHSTIGWHCQNKYDLWIKIWPTRMGTILGFLVCIIFCYTCKTYERNIKCRVMFSSCIFYDWSLLLWGWK